jgi:hypothetical protein
MVPETPGVKVVVVGNNPLETAAELVKLIGVPALLNPPLLVMEIEVVPSVALVAVNVCEALDPEVNVIVVGLNVAPDPAGVTTTVEPIVALGVTVNVEAWPVVPVVGPERVRVVAEAEELV